MEKSFEKNYSVGEKEKEPSAPEIEIPKKEWQTLEIIAKRVGGDFGMEVKLGEPGKGSFFDPENCSIALDPLHIKEKPEQAKFVAGHEGSHRAITPSPKEIGLTKEQIKEYYSQIGFGYLQNVIEDPAVNDWMNKRFPGLKEYTQETYDEQLKEENAVLSTPEVQRVAAQLGYWPRFSQYGSEIIRDWHQKRFSKKLDPAVEKALKRTRNLARESISTIPDPDEPTRERKKVVAASRKRFENNTNYIWPEVKKLVEMDLKTERDRQMLEDFRKMQKELKQKQKEMEEAQKQGDRQKAEELQKEIEGIKQELDPFNGLPQDAKEELEKEIDKAIGETAGKLNKEIEEKQKQAQEAKEKQEQLDKEIKDLEEKAKNASGKEKEELEKEIEKKKAEKAVQEMKQKQAESELKNIQDILDDVQSGEGMPYPEDKLSDKTKKELEKLYNKLPKKKQDKIEDQAKESLENLEDALNQEMEGKLNEDKPESHKERREREQAERQAASRSREAKEDTKRMEQELERIRREKMTPYEQARSEVSPLIDDLYYRLRRILMPEEFGGEELDQPRGTTPQMERIMQAEIDPTQLKKAWVSETAPEKKDYRFWHLVDLSRSMRSGEIVKIKVRGQEIKIPKKIWETLKGLIVVSEAVDRIENLNSDIIEVHQGITGFSDDIYPIKGIGLGQRLDQEIRKKLEAIPQLVSGGTNTYAGTIEALKKLGQNLGESGNYLMTFSDGEPNDDIKENLKGFLKEAFEERRKRNIKIGLIWIGEVFGEKELKNLEESYSDDLANLTPEQKKEIGKLKSKGDFHSAAVKILVYVYGYDFGLAMPAVNPEGKEGGFARKLADLMEELVKHPEKY